jgi:hypothetical protein
LTRAEHRRWGRKKRVGCLSEASSDTRGPVADAQDKAGQGRLLLVRFLDGSAKNPISALRFISRHCGVQYVRLIPQDSQALISNFFQNRLNDELLRVRLFIYTEENEEGERIGFVRN